MGFDITKFLVSSAAVTGIGFLWFNFNQTVFYAVRDILIKNVKEINDLDVEPEKYISERIENIYSLIKQLLEDKQKMLKAVQDGKDVEELKNKIFEQIEIICWKCEKLEEDCEEPEIEEKMKLINYFCSLSEKMVDEQDASREFENIKEQVKKIIAEREIEISLLPTQ